MAHELSIAKEACGVALSIETKEKIMFKYGRPNESFSSAMRRICERLVKDVKLPKAIIEKIDAKIAENYRKRMLARKKGTQSS